MPDLKSSVFDRSLPPWERLKAVMAVLRSANGCAWDRKQTHKSLLPYLIEEAYELVEAIESGDKAALREELGDLLCQVVFHGQLAREDGHFETDDAVEGIVEKLISRHPHVFGEHRDLNPRQVRDQWEKIKIESGEKKSVLNGLPASMPALTMAFRMGEKAGGVGFDWENPGDVVEKIREEVKEIEQALRNDDKDALAEEIGDLLFATASLSRQVDIDPERALKRGLEKFRSRFGLLEEKVAASGKNFRDFSLEELEEIWQSVKHSL